jgi:hypothetical protein
MRQGVWGHLHSPNILCLAYDEFQEQQTEPTRTKSGVLRQLCKISGRNLHQWLLKPFIVPERAQNFLVCS